MISDPDGPERRLARETSPPRGSESHALLPVRAREWPTSRPGDPVIAVATTGAVTAMNVAAVTLVFPPAPYLVTVREAPTEPRPSTAPITRRVRQFPDHPSPVVG
jgi:hypothetical protein